jgi:thiol-disulfide isomerase/thioredoxin
LGKIPANQNFQFDAPSNFVEVDKLEAGMSRARTLEMIGKPAPNFKANTLDGVSTSLSDFRGKLVLLDFWATWCAPCRDQMPKIAKLYDQTREQGLVLLGINDDESIEKPIEYMKQHAYQWLNLFESKPGSIRRNFAVDGIPTLILIDREGKVIEYQVGSGAESEEKIRAALRKQGLKLD